MRVRAIRSIPVAILATLAPMVMSATAHASLLAGNGQNCGTPVSSQVFLPWADVANYYMLPGGNFENGAAGWTLTGGSGVVAGNESFDVGGASDSNSLSLPAGSSATSPTTCVGIANPDIRYFAQNTGDPTSTLQVSVNYVGPLGVSESAVIGQIAAPNSWQPTLQDPILVNLLPLLPGNLTPVSFTFTPQGAGGNWQIDDVYVDPWGRN